MAECLTAWKDGEDTDLASTGAMLVAEGLVNLDVCARFALEYAKYLNRVG